MNGTVTYNGTVTTSVARQICERGFVLIGEPLKTCLESGKWSGLDSKCGKHV